MKRLLLGSALAAVPMPRKFLGRYGPWARFAAHRRGYDEIRLYVNALMEDA